MQDGLGEALGRFNSSAAPEEAPAKESAPKSEGGGKHKGHSGHIHRHENGKHHVTVHDKHGQLVHHSEHANWGDAASELGTHGAGGGSSDMDGDE